MTAHSTIVARAVTMHVARRAMRRIASARALSSRM